MIDFIIVGAQKGGTTAAAHNLDKHPDVSVFLGVTEYGQHEIEFYNQHWEKGREWYFDQLPITTGVIGEKTAELMHRTICHERIYQINPNVKLIAILRDPVKRAYSQWRMAFFKKGDENRTFDEVVLGEYQSLEDRTNREQFYTCSKKNINSWREGYILKGFYFEQLKSLYNFFPRENVHIAISERVRANKTYEYNRMFSFLDLKPYYGSFEDRFINGNPDPINKATYELLKTVYLKPNEDLFNMLGFEVEEWNRP